MGQHWESQYDIPKDFCFTLMKTSNLAVMMMKCLVLHLELMMDTHLGLIKEFIWVFFILFMLLMKVILRFYFPIKHLYQMMKLNWDTMVVFLMDLNMVCFMVQHWVYHLDIMMGFCLPQMKASELALPMGNCLVFHL